MARTPEYYRRKVARNKPRDLILIVCEGAKTEPNYFRSFRLSSVHVVPAKCNTRSVVEVAIEEVNLAKSQRCPEFDQVWCVFDKDSFDDSQFNEAIALAEKQGFHVAYSNEAFELWYLLHFDLISSPMSRDRYKGILTKKLNRIYEKNDKAIYDSLIAMQSIAIRNAKKLWEIRPFRNPAQDNPSTTVYLLVEELNSLQRK